MRQDLQEKIVAICPNVVFSMPQWWGFECDNGWFELLRDLFAELNELPNIGKTPFTCVKQKYAELRVYYKGVRGFNNGVAEGGDPAINAAIQKAASRALATCEKCGKEGRPVVSERGWHRVTCTNHRKLGDQNRHESDMGVGVRWFGPPWKAPICGPHNRIETPSVPCYLCGKDFAPEDRGLTMPFIGGPDDPHTLSGHLECVSISLGLKTPKTV